MSTTQSVTLERTLAAPVDLVWRAGLVLTHPRAEHEKIRPVEHYHEAILLPALVAAQMIHPRLNGPVVPQGGPEPLW